MKSFIFARLSVRSNCFLGIVLLLLIVASGPVFLVQAQETPVPSNGLVILLTDFGTKDFYVGAMKGAIYSVFPEARIDSISHDVTPFAIREGAYTLAKAAVEFPAGTVFVVVVDPGVGTPRKPIVMQTEAGKFFVAPDNGILTVIGERLGVVAVREITNPALMRGGALSSTFHGRDIFGPVGASLARGIPFEQVGPTLDNYLRLDVSQARLSEGRILGRVELIDEYGNVLTNIPQSLFDTAHMDQGQMLPVWFEAHKAPIRFKYVNTYGDVPVGDYVALFGSGGVLEFAINQANLAKTLKLRQGIEVQIPLSQAQSESPPAKK